MQRIQKNGQSALNLAVARLRYFAGTAWSTKRYLNIELISIIPNRDNVPPARHRSSAQDRKLASSDGARRKRAGPSSLGPSGLFG
jgi:hypothetical protein